jgi:hypothetical protein
VADIIVDSKTRAAWVPTIANINAPTVAELNAGMLLQSTMTPSGLAGFAPDTAKVDNSSLASRYNTGRVGKVSFDGTRLQFKRQTGTDTIHDTLVYQTTGYIVIRRSVAESTAWTTGQKVSVYPAECAETVYLDPEENTVERYEVPITITDAPQQRATVA